MWGPPKPYDRLLRSLLRSLGSIMTNLCRPETCLISFFHNSASTAHL